MVLGYLRQVIFTKLTLAEDDFRTKIQLAQLRQFQTVMNRQIHKIARIPIRNVAFKFKDRLLGNSIAADGLTRSEATGMNFSNYLTQNL